MRSAISRDSNGLTSITTVENADADGGSALTLGTITDGVSWSTFTMNRTSTGVYTIRFDIRLRPLFAFIQLAGNRTTSAVDTFGPGTFRTLLYYDDGTLVNKDFNFTAVCVDNRR